MSSFGLTGSISAVWPRRSGNDDVDVNYRMCFALCGCFGSEMCDGKMRNLGRGGSRTKLSSGMTENVKSREFYFRGNLCPDA